MLVESCWQDLQSPPARYLQRTWRTGMSNLWASGLSQKLHICPLIWGSHTLDTLRPIWEHVKMHIPGFNPQRCRFSDLELGPTTWIFYDCGRVLKQFWSREQWTLWECGSEAHIQTVLMAASLIANHSVLPPSSILILLYLCLWTLVSAPVLLWFCSFLVHRGQPQRILTLWFLASASATCPRSGSGWILHYMLNCSRVMPSLTPTASVRQLRLSFAILPCLSFMPLVPDTLWTSNVMKNLGRWQGHHFEFELWF